MGLKPGQRVGPTILHWKHQNNTPLRSKHLVITSHQATAHKQDEPPTPLKTKSNWSVVVAQPPLRARQRLQICCRNSEYLESPKNKLGEDGDFSEIFYALIQSPWSLMAKYQISPKTSKRTDSKPHAPENDKMDIHKPEQSPKISPQSKSTKVERLPDP